MTIDDKRSLSLRRNSPDFICIGPEKTGTTLLYRLLQEHPNVLLPIMKEIRFWDEGINIPNHTIGRVLCSDHWHYAILRKRLRRRSKSEIKRLALFRWKESTDFYWWLRYTLGHRSEDWYESLFSPEFVTGDISPLYYHLPEESVKKISRYKPDIKIVVFIRDPIERAWSKIKMNMLSHKGRELDQLSFEEFKRYSETVRAKWVPYLETVRMWQQYFPQIHVSLFDDLQSNQLHWYRGLCDFLGLDPSIAAVGEVKFVNSGKSVSIPREYEEVLKAQYWKEIVELQHHYPHLDWSQKYLHG